MTIIRIKRSSVTGNPNKLAAGELAYSALTDNGANGGDRLYIGIGAETAGNAANHFVIGGKFFTDRLDHTAGVLTTSSAVVVDADSKIDIFNVDNLRLDGNTLSSTDLNGNIIFNPNGNGLVSIANAYTLPRVDSTSGYVLTTNGAGAASWQPASSTLSVSGDFGNGQIDLLTETLTLAGGVGLTSTVTNNTITIDLDNTTVAAGTYGSATQIGTFTVDAQGRLTSASNISIATTLNIAADGATTSSVSLLTETLTIEGGINVDTVASAQKITISVDTATNSVLGVASFTATNFNVADGHVSIKDASIGNHQLTSSTVTINSITVPLGGSATIGSALNQGITFGTGLAYTNISGGFFNGNTATTITVDDTIATTATHQTLTNKVIDATNNTLTNLTNANLSGSAGITNANLQYSSITLGSDSISLGGTTSSFRGVTIDATANTVTNLSNANLNGNAGITNANLQYSYITLGSNSVSLGETTSTLAGLTISALNNTISALTNSNLSGSAGITNANLQHSSITLGSTAVSLGASTATIADLTEIEVGNITIKLGEISSTGNLNLNAGNTGTIIVNGVKITGLGTPTGSTDAATKSYVDGVAQGLDVKDSVVAATTASITLSGTQTIDGILVQVGQRVLVKAQANPEENGIYIVDSSLWTRSLDTNTWDELVSAFTFVEKGLTYGDTGWVCTVDSGGTLDTDPVNWSQFSGAGTYLAGTGLALTGNTFSISTTYVGQSSITTLGTITAGTWNANTIAANYGGTGFTSYSAYDILIGNNSGGLSKLAIGLPGEVLQVNTAGNALIYADIDGGEY